MHIIGRCLTTAFAMVLVVLLGGQYSAHAWGSSLTGNPANAPILEASINGGISLAPVSAVTTGSTATAAVSVASGTGAGLGSVTSSALGGTAGLALLGGGIAAWNWHTQGATALPTPSGAGTTFDYLGVGGNAKFGATEVRPVTVSVSTAFPLAPAPGQVSNTPQVGIAISLTAGPDAPACSATNGLWCLNGYGRVIIKRYCVGSSTPVNWGGTYVLNPAGSYSASIAQPTVPNCGPQGIDRYEFVIPNGVSPTSPSTFTGETTNTLSFLNPPASVPKRSVEQTVTCKNAAGTTHTLASTTAPAALGPGAVVPVAGLQCPDGERLTKLQRKIKTEGAPDTAFPDVLVPTELDVIPQTCFAAATKCELQLQRHTETGWETCVSGGPCPSTWTNVAKTPSNFRCRMGGTGVPFVAVPFKWCSSLYPSPSDPNKISVIPRTGTDPNPNPGTDPDPNPQTNGDCELGWADLLSGAVFVKGSKCVLSWAFVPRENFWADQLGEAQTAFSSSGPGQWVTPVAGVFTAFHPPTSTDCHGPVWHIPLGALPGGGPTFRPFDVCGEPQITMAMWTKTVSTVAIILFGALAAGRWILGAFGIGVPGRQAVPDGD